MTQQQSKAAASIVTFVCGQLNIPEEDFLTDKRHQLLVDARIIATILMRSELSLSPTDISIFIRKNHKTISYYLNKVNEVNKPLQEKLQTTIRNFSSAKWSFSTADYFLAEKNELLRAIGEIEFLQFTEGVLVKRIQQKVKLFNQLIQLNIQHSNTNEQQNTDIRN